MHLDSTLLGHESFFTKLKNLRFFFWFARHIADLFKKNVYIKFYLLAKKNQLLQQKKGTLQNNFKLFLKNIIYHFIFLK